MFCVDRITQGHLLLDIQELKNQWQHSNRYHTSFPFPLLTPRVCFWQIWFVLNNNVVLGVLSTIRVGQSQLTIHRIYCWDDKSKFIIYISGQLTGCNSSSQMNGHSLRALTYLSHSTKLSCSIRFPVLMINRICMFSLNFELRLRCWNWTGLPCTGFKGFSASHNGAWYGDDSCTGICWKLGQGA